MRTFALCLPLLASLLAGCNNDSQLDITLPANEPTAQTLGPWQRTEDRAPCTNFNRLRTPYFGDLHVHTRFSADAYIFGTRGGPRDAYRFAQGESIAVSDDVEQQTRQVHLDRPLDFAAVTDHAEFFGEVRLCDTPGSPVYNDNMCELLRQAENPNDRFNVTVAWLFPAGIDNPPSSHAFCFLPGIDCDAGAISVWKEMQTEAEAAYDRSADCNFTTFIGYENTASRLGRHLHRNVIFRNDHVPAFAASYLETAAGGVPQGVWTAVEHDCLDAGTGCDALIIPHNSNLSEGQQWLDPADATEAQRRQDREPLVEIHQMKGNSECRFDRLASLGVQTQDELCAFEQLSEAHQGPDATILPIDQYPARNMVRNTLKDGLQLEEMLGVNPFQMGFVGSTDTHNATAGNVDEVNWEGGQGNGDSSAPRQIADEVRNNPGGLAVVWAEENSRDAIFAALARRETYATTGIRPVVRFFAGSLEGLDCESSDFAEAGYRGGTSMGGEIGPVRGDSSPRFAVMAAKDPGTSAIPGTDLQRVQIVKGWVDASGATQERVFDVAGDAHNGAGVDPASCDTVGSGARELCAVWEDPQFDRSQRAFYYVRLLENPSCRWSTRVCKAAGVDPFAADCAAQAQQAGGAFANCCLNSDNDPTLSPVIQERAWTSPIWYRPEAVARVIGGIAFGSGVARDVLDIEIHLGRLPEQFDASADAISLRISDSEEILALQLPPDTLRATPGGVFTVEPGSIDGIESFSLTTGQNGEAVLALKTTPRDLSRVGNVDHSVTVTLQLGISRFTHSRTWLASAGHLGPEAN
jgi:hypothetical protein